MTQVALHSKTFPGKYLRLDGQGVTSPLANGGGTANTQTYIGTYETFTLVRNTNGTVSFKSTVFNNVFLRLDGRNVIAGKVLQDGGGVVNGQFNEGSYEQFRIHKLTGPPNTYHGVVGLESAAFPGRYLRVNGDKNQVNVQGVFQTFEQWEILVVGVDK